MPRASWSIVTMMTGIPEVTLPFIAHHLESDVAKIHIYLDNPDPVLEAALTGNRRIDLTVCDDAFWAATRLGRRPANNVQRQKIVSRRAKRRSSSEWLVHIDSDEFLVPSQTDVVSISEELAAVPEHFQWARIKNCERVFAPSKDITTIFDGVFRAQIPDARLRDAVYGQYSGFLNNGFSGYVQGKVAVRTGAPVRLHLHDVSNVSSQTQGPRSKAQRVEDDAIPPFYPVTGTKILHFDGWTPTAWIAKILLRNESSMSGGHKGRRKQKEFMSDVVSPDERRKLFDNLMRLSADALMLMRSNNLVDERRFDPSSAVARHFPDVEVDFRVMEFDRKLRHDNPEFFQRHNL